MRAARCSSGAHAAAPATAVPPGPVVAAPPALRELRRSASSFAMICCRCCSVRADLLLLPDWAAAAAAAAGPGEGDMARTARQPLLVGAVVCLLCCGACDAQPLAPAASWVGEAAAGGPGLLLAQGPLQDVRARPCAGGATSAPPHATEASKVCLANNAPQHACHDESQCSWS
jgi:hypothetical protein